MGTFSSPRVTSMVTEGCATMEAKVSKPMA